MRLRNVKVTEFEDAFLQKKADKFFCGNVSELMRTASLEFQPKKKDLFDPEEELRVMDMADEAEQD